MKVLIVGFSVLNGLIDRFTKNGEVNFSIRALGGNHFEVLPFIIDQLLVEEAPDVVILDLVSTPRAARWTHDLFDDAARFIVYSCQKRNCKVAFANLYRFDVDQDKDFLHSAVRAIAAEVGAPVLDMLSIHKANNHNLKEVYPDGNHPSDIGRSLLGDALNSLAQCCDKPQKNCGLPHFYVAKTPTSLRFDIGDGVFSRFGFNLKYKNLVPGKTGELKFPPGFELCGLIMVMGPRSGEVTINYSNISIKEMIYDKFCYYERLKHIHLVPKLANKVSIEQMADTPSIPLAKGVLDSSPRLGGVVACLGYLT